MATRFTHHNSLPDRRTLKQPGRRISRLAEHKASDSINTPTAAELRQLERHDDVELDEALLEKIPFFTSDGREARAQTNGDIGFFLGKTAAGDDAWAHLVLITKDFFLTDSSGRAIVVVQAVKDRVATACSLADVADPVDALKGKNLVETFKFVYGCLVDEADFMTA